MTRAGGARSFSQVSSSPGSHFILVEHTPEPFGPGGTLDRRESTVAHVILDHRKAMLEDISVLTGGTAIMEETGIKLRAPEGHALHLRQPMGRQRPQGA